mmetsp:Transcript_67633/g.195792  ORF Transcript_67633/g.195792 Transcript_67633/m.195792 type:complete len:187 (-) Transcript_67633:142-702(-)
MEGSDDIVPNFGGGDDLPAPETSPTTGTEAAVPCGGATPIGHGMKVDGDDELSFAASFDKVQEMTEQLAEFLVKFSDIEQRAILAPFLSGQEVTKGDPTVEAHIDEARQFICTYLAVYSEPERDLILEKWRPAFDTASLSTATESLTPSVTPPGSVTPTAVTPREFLSARRQLHDPSPTPPGEPSA